MIELPDDIEAFNRKWKEWDDANRNDLLVHTWYDVEPLCRRSRSAEKRARRAEYEKKRREKEAVWKSYRQT